MLGFFLVLLAAFFFCFQNVIVRVLFSLQPVFGLMQTGGFVEPTLPNSFLLLVMRTVLVVPLMAVLAPSLYPATWKDIRQLATVEKRRELRFALAGGLFMFLYLALLYLAIGLIPTGIALTLFFTYPVFTALFAWKLFGTRPSALLWGVMGLIFVGSTLTVPQATFSLAHNSALGVALAIASGIVYALYSVNAQKSFEHTHPVPFTWVSFATTLVLSGLSLLVWHGQLNDLPWTPLWIGSLLSGIVTLTGHLLNNIGIRIIGATTASLIASTNPALTVMLAWLAIQETLTGKQLIGVVIVTLSVALLSRNRSLSKAD
ncbi:EamA family transporter [Pseudanabaena sp. FACHB-2040]|uniref:EamA family transporter n=1 Tax=Pseudanabaena sp. FACHB-2040 TaxID=2692859 RepID=UPI0016870188|nr:DMT family transporter [Pseudanabaena sp. FACHB-2040]